MKNLKDHNPDEIADLRRAAIVFLFASFEDTLRTTKDFYTGIKQKEVTTFGNVDTVVNLLRNLGLDLNNFRPLFPEMATFMLRRHRIVHEADLVQPNAITDAPWTIGDDYQGVIWFCLVIGFVSKLRAALDPSAIVDEWFAEEWTESVKKLTAARQTFLAISPNCFEEKLKGLQNLLSTIGEIETVIRRPNDETARSIADKYGIPY